MAASRSDLYSAQASFNFEKDPLVSSDRNNLIDIYKGLISQRPSSYVGNEYPSILPSSQPGTANLSAAAKTTEQTPLLNTVRWNLQATLMSYMLNSNDLPSAMGKVLYSTEFMYQWHDIAFRSAGGAPTVERPPWALLSLVNVPETTAQLLEPLAQAKSFVGATAAFLSFSPSVWNDFNPAARFAAASSARDSTLAVERSNNYSLGEKLIGWSIGAFNDPSGKSNIGVAGKMGQYIFWGVTLATFNNWD